MDFVLFVACFLFNSTNILLFSWIPLLSQVRQIDWLTDGHFQLLLSIQFWDRRVITWQYQTDKLQPSPSDYNTRAMQQVKFLKQFLQHFPICVTHTRKLETAIQKLIRLVISRHWWPVAHNEFFCRLPVDRKYSDHVPDTRKNGWINGEVTRYAFLQRHAVGVGNVAKNYICWTFGSHHTYRTITIWHIIYFYNCS